MTEAERLLNAYREWISDELGWVLDESWDEAKDEWARESLEDFHKEKVHRAALILRQYCDE